MRLHKCIDEKGQEYSRHVFFDDYEGATCENCGLMIDAAHINVMLRVYLEDTNRPQEKETNDE